MINKILAQPNIFRKLTDTKVQGSIKVIFQNATNITLAKPAEFVRFLITPRQMPGSFPKWPHPTRLGGREEYVALNALDKFLKQSCRSKVMNFFKFKKNLDYIKIQNAFPFLKINVRNKEIF